MNSLNQRLETVKPVLDYGVSELEVALAKPTSDLKKADAPKKKRRGWRVKPADRYQIDASDTNEPQGNWITRLLTGWMFSLILHSLILVLLGTYITNIQTDGPISLEVSMVADDVDDAISIDIAPMEFDDAGGDPLEAEMPEEQVVENLVDHKHNIDLSLAQPASSEIEFNAATDDSLFESVALGSFGLDEAAKGKGTGQSDGSGVKFFGLESTGNRFVFVVDSSGSMSDERRYLRAVRELTRSLNMLKTNQRFLVILYNTEVYPMLGMTNKNIRLLPATRKNKNRVLSWLSEQQPQSQTTPKAAMAASLMLQPSSIYFLSDGEFHDHTTVMLETLNVDNESAGYKKIPINTITLGSTGLGAPTMLQIANTSGGQFRWVR